MLQGKVNNMTTLYDEQYNRGLERAEMEAVGGFHSKASLKNATRNLDDAFRALKMRDIPTGEFHGETFDNFGVQFPTHPELIGKEIMEYQSVDIWNFKPEKHLSEYHELDRPKAMKLYELWHKYKSMGITAKPKVKREIKFTEQQATHWGTCQVCGSRHKVGRKHGRIAVHGYTTIYGGHDGACFGSKHEPLELSCSISKAWIKALEKAKIANHQNSFVKDDRHGNPTRYVKLWLKENEYKKEVQRTVTLEWADRYIDKQINQTQKVVDNWKKKDLIPIEVWE
tara:strand:+ start:777 stop:1625 length:849 start_codon:yes stop_codon:yes gene_type:complete